MKLLEFNGKNYLRLKDHTFLVINSFQRNYYDNIFIQCVSNNRYGIIKEYLPKNWELIRTRVNGRIIYTLYDKKYFNYNTKAENKGRMTFISTTLDGAYFLAYQWLLQILGYEVNNDNITKLKEYFKIYHHNSRHFTRLTGKSEQLLHGVIFNTRGSDPWYMEQISYHLEKEEEDD